MSPLPEFSALQHIQSTILRFTKMLASVLQLEVEIVDAHMVRIAGTGPYAKRVGNKLHSNSRLLEHVLRTHEEKIVVHSRTDPMCAGCVDYGECDERAFIGVPIMAQQSCVGVISLVALNPEQQARIRENSREISEYVRHISSIFVAKLIDDQGGGDDFHKILVNCLGENMDQGVIVLDESEEVRFINAVALKQLDCPREKIVGRIIGIRPLTMQQNRTSGHLQHIVSFADRQEIIIGQLHHVQDHLLFLMAFHQSHQAVPSGDENNDPRIEHIIGESPSMRTLKSLLTRVAASPSSVLIVSESGTGKEIVARAIHQLSGRNRQPFVAINCASIPEALQESELFGYVKGAFTGASTSGKVGLIQAANGGTLFLDEIGDMPLGLQAKLLRAIEAREVQPIGASRPLPVDIRIVAATHRNLRHSIEAGSFREDLFYRLNVIPLSIPPLRERAGDIELLTHYFINLHIRRIGGVYPGIAPEVLRLLAHYPWPGNVRELSNLMEYLVNVVPNGEVIGVELLPPSITEGRGGRLKTEIQERSRPENTRPCAAEAEPAVLENIERQAIEAALARHPNKKAAAHELGIGIATLYRKIKKYGF